MIATLTKTLLEDLEVGDYDVVDTRQPLLTLRVRRSGRHAYLVRLGKGRKRGWYTLGDARHMTPARARELANQALVDFADGRDPREARRKARAGVTFADFYRKTYEPWFTANRRSGQGMLYAFEKQFLPLLGSKHLAEIDAFTIERWRVARLKGGVKPITVNKELGTLKAALNRAVGWGLLKDNPLRAVRRGQEDRAGVVRYLTPSEEAALRQALTRRDVDRIHARVRANAWRRTRGYRETPDLGPYGDHLTPIILLALNTGLRRGELLGLTWSDVDLVGARLTVRGESAKSGRTRYVPLNLEALQVLKEWQRDATADLVFPDPDSGEQMFSLKTAWAAVLKAATKEAKTIADFRFHDLRHTFASKLVQRGVDLATVRELLGHSDFSLTLRYAHLAAENKVAAVATLVG